MLAQIKGTYEGTSVQLNGDKVTTSVILNQIGQEDKVKVKVSDGFKFPELGASVLLNVEIRKGSFQGKPYVSMKALN